MARRTIWSGCLGGTIWAIPSVMLFALLVPSTVISAFTLGALLCGVIAQLLPHATVPEVARSARLARQGKWAQANFYNILAQHKLRRSPWKAGFRAFRTPFETPNLLLALRADSGRLLLGLGQYREAERVLRGVLTEPTTGGACPRWHALPLHNLAVALHAQGRQVPASAALRRALDLGYIQPAPEILAKTLLRRLGIPARLSFQETRVAFYQSLGFHEIALNCTLVGSDSDTIWRRTLSLLALSRQQTASDEVLAELGQRPGNPFAWLAHGFLCAQGGRKAEAVAAYNRALNANRANPSPVLSALATEQLCLLHTRSGDPKSMLNTLAVLQEYESDRQIMALGKALLMGGLKRWKEALEETVAAGPLARTLLTELAGHALIETGRPQAGCRLLRRFRVHTLTSGLPMLDREARLARATEAVTRYLKRDGGFSERLPKK